MTANFLVPCSSVQCLEACEVVNSAGEAMLLIYTGGFAWAATAVGTAMACHLPCAQDSVTYTARLHSLRAPTQPQNSLHAVLQKILDQSTHLSDTTCKGVLLDEARRLTCYN